MRLLVVSHKLCWEDPASPTGYSTDGGFPDQMRALSELMDETTILLPLDGTPHHGGKGMLSGKNFRVIPLPKPRADEGVKRKLAMIPWTAANIGRIRAFIEQADCVHTPIPGDIGTVGMLAAHAAKKPLFVRYCGNWTVQHTAMERFWRRFMERNAGGRNVMLATGWAPDPPSALNPNIKWIFSTTLTEERLKRQARKRTLPERRPLRLITVGRLEKGKGIHRSIAAVRMLADRGVDCVLDIVGDGPQRDMLAAEADRQGVGNRIRFLGRTDREGVFAFLADADLFLFPTDTEGFPKAVVEAMASGLPVVATPVSALPHVLGRGGGILMRDSSPASIAGSVESCIADPRRYAAMSEKAVETAASYTLERWKQELAEILTSVWGPLRER
ncbi:MAG: glycosyltransferase family 4 protein [Bacteroidota bacterium]|nr:glycosyltransferase family 4 protein [Bacteroidota bacterium]